MSAAESSPTLNVARISRARLWASAIARSVHNACWAGACIFVLSGGVHVLIRGHSMLVPAAVSAAFIVCALTYGFIARRPSLRQAARVADDYLNANWLLVSAVDQLLVPKPDRLGCADHVIAASDRLSAGWKASLRRPNGSYAARWLGPYLAVLVAAFLHQLPGAAASDPRTSRLAGVSSDRPSLAAERMSAAVSDLLAWRSDGHAPDASSNPGRQPAESTPAGTPSASEPSPATTKDAAIGSDSPASSTPTGIGASAPAPGNALPAGELHARRGHNETVIFREFELHRLDSNSRKGSGAAQLALREARKTRRTAHTRAISAPPLPATTHLSPLERAYAAAYLRALETLR